MGKYASGLLFFLRLVYAFQAEQGAALHPQGTRPLTLFCFAFFACETGT
jgi:hypothetical protein